MIRKNLFWKLLALAVSLALWTYVNAERNPQSRKVFTVPLEARNLAKGYVAEFPDAKEVAVTLQGPQRIVDEIRKDDVSAWLSLSSKNAGGSVSEQISKVYARVAGVAMGDIDVRVSPATAKVRTEEVRWKRLPVEIKFLAPPPLGFSYSEPEIEPSSVAVSGKTSSVSRVAKVVIAVSGDHDSRRIDDDFRAVAVDAKGNAVGSVELDEDSVHLKLRFVEAPATKVVIVSPTIVGQPKFPAAVSRVVVAPPTVTLEGRPAVLMDLSMVATDPIQIEGTQTDITQETALRMPSNARIMGRRTVRVTVHITSPD